MELLGVFLSAALISNNPHIRTPLPINSYQCSKLYPGINDDYFSYGLLKDFRKKFPWIALTQFKQLGILIRNGEVFSKDYVLTIQDQQGKDIKLEKGPRDSPCRNRQIRA